jgi:hypothetical protein
MIGNSLIVVVALIVTAIAVWAAFILSQANRGEAPRRNGPDPHPAKVAGRGSGARTRRARFRGERGSVPRRATPRSPTPFRESGASRAPSTASDSEVRDAAGCVRPKARA